MSASSVRRPSSAPLGGRCIRSRRGQLRIVLVGDQDLGDVALGGEAQLHAVAGQRFWESRKRGHASVADRSLVDAMTARRAASDATRTTAMPTTCPTPSADPTGPAAFGSRSTRTAASKSCCPRRPRARRGDGGRRARAVDRAAPGRGRRRARRRSPPAATRSRISARSCRCAQSPGAHARTGAARCCWCPPARGGARRSSAGTGARPAARSRRGSTTHARRPARYTRLTIRAQRTRWASCSRTGAMSFNWRLLLAPGPRLRRLARGLSPARDGSLAAVLGAARLLLPGLQRAAKRWLRRYGQTLVL